MLTVTPQLLILLLLVASVSRSLVSPCSDELEVDVLMSESVLPQTVLLMGQTKVVKALLRNNTAYGNYAKLLQVRPRAELADFSRVYAALIDCRHAFKLQIIVPLQGNCRVLCVHKPDHQVNKLLLF